MVEEDSCRMLLVFLGAVHILRAAAKEKAARACSEILNPARAAKGALLALAVAGEAHSVAAVSLLAAAVLVALSVKVVVAVHLAEMSARACTLEVVGLTTSHLVVARNPAVHLVRHVEVAPSRHHPALRRAVQQAARCRSRPPL